jgi:hypothetical protein
LTLTTTPGDAGANSYASVADADAYFATRVPNELWEAVTDDEDRKRLLIATTRHLDTADWDGEPTFPNQRLKFPRTGLTDSDGRTIDSLTYPRLLVEATCEELYAFLTHGITKDRNAVDKLLRFETLTAGSISITPNADFDAGNFAPMTYRLISDFLRFSPDASFFRIVRS